VEDAEGSKYRPVARGLNGHVPPPDPPISDVAAADRNLTGYKKDHFVPYLRLLDADAEGADWQEVAKIVLHIDPEREPISHAPNGSPTRALPDPGHVAQKMAKTVLRHLVSVEYH
jgi:hypothetical protein